MYIALYNVVLLFVAIYWVDLVANHLNIILRCSVFNQRLHSMKRTIGVSKQLILELIANVEHQTVNILENSVTPFPMARTRLIGNMVSKKNFEDSKMYCCEIVLTSVIETSYAVSIMDSKN